MEEISKIHYFFPSVATRGLSKAGNSHSLERSLCISSGHWALWLPFQDSVGLMLRNPRLAEFVTIRGEKRPYHFAYVALFLE